MAQVVRGGNAETFGFQLDWRDRPAQSSFAFREQPRSAAERTRGDLVLWARGRAVWGFERGSRVRGFRWTWIDLLEHFARVWPYLCWEEGYPLGLGPPSPGDLLSTAETAFADLRGPQRDAADQTLYDFCEAHDLAFGVPGVRLPSVWVVTLGELAVVAGNGFRVELSKSEALGTIEKLGDAIFDRLQSTPDARAKVACDGWTKRNTQSPERLASIYARLDEQKVVQLRGKRTFAQMFELAEAGEFRPTELLAVARGTGSELAPDDLRALLDQLRKVPAVRSEKLEALTQEARVVKEEVAMERPPEQAAHLARWLRRRLELDDRPVNPARLLKVFGVAVREISLGAPSIDAVCVWGPRHGPTVFLNRDGLHAQRMAGKNSTLAHEICHLLLDRDGAYPLAEVFTRSSLPIEARARAFAAELLMPAAVVAAAFASDGKPKKVLKALCSKFGVSAELVAWQAHNSGADLSQQARAVLRAQVSRTELFSM